MLLKYIASTTWLVGIMFTTLASGDDHSGDQVWKVDPAGESKALDNYLGNYNFDVWRNDESSVHVRVTSEQRKSLESFLKAKNINYKVMIENVEAALQKQKSGTRRQSSKGRSLSNLDEFDYTVYHNATEIYSWIDMIAEKYDFVHKKQVSVTYEGRPVYVLEITKESAAPKPKIYIDALIHCREWITTAALIKVFNDMIVSNSTMLYEVDWYFIPMINVDGYIETWTGNRFWRKTRSTGASSLCVGVDGNRNFDDNWSLVGASPNPCSYAFYGPTPASESEVRHLQNYILSMNFASAVTVHAYTQLILYPFNYKYELPSANDKLNATAKLMHDAIKSVHGKNYRYGPGAATIYQCSGVTSDWTYNKAGIEMSFAYELRDEGEYGFLLPPEQIVPTAEEMYAAMEALSEDIANNF